MRNRQFNVLQVISNLEIGGAQEVVRTLADYLALEGCGVVVCTFRDGPLRHEIERLGIPVEILPARRASILHFPRFVGDMLRIRRALLSVAHRHNIDVVQTHLLRVLDFLVLTLRWSVPLRVFWTVHNYQFALRADQLPRYRWLAGPKRWAYRALYRVAAQWVAAFIAVSDEVETAIVETIGPVGDKIVIIANGVDVKRYGQPVDKARIRQQLGVPAQARVLAVVGTLKEQKGHRYLIDAAPAVVAQFPDTHWLLVGGGALRETLQAQANAAGLAQHIHFLGNRSDVAALLASSDGFVLPSLWEGLPMALIEAMASGLPIVATEVSGTKQVMVSGETGLLVPPGSVPHLEAAMIELLANPECSQVMGAGAHRRVEASFSARKQAEEHVALFQRAWAHDQQPAEQPAQET